MALHACSSSPSPAALDISNPHAQHDSSTLLTSACHSTTHSHTSSGRRLRLHCRRGSEGRRVVRRVEPSWEGRASLLQPLGWLQGLPEGCCGGGKLQRGRREERRRQGGGVQLQSEWRRGLWWQSATEAVVGGEASAVLRRFAQGEKRGRREGSRGSRQVGRGRDGAGAAAAGEEARGGGGWALSCTGLLLPRPLNFSSRMADVDPHQICSLWEVCLNETRDPKRVVTAFRHSFAFVVVVDENAEAPGGKQGRVVGVGRAISDGSFVATICDVAVHPEYQRRGIGRRIVRKLVQDMKRKGPTGFAVFPPPLARRFFWMLGFRSDKKYRLMAYRGKETGLADSSSRPDAASHLAGSNQRDEFSDEEEHARGVLDDEEREEESGQHVLAEVEEMGKGMGGDGGVGEGTAAKEAVAGAAI